MSESIRRALEAHLAGMTPALATAWENTQFTPMVGTPYQEPRLLPASPDNFSMGSRHYIEVGIFQVLLKYPIGAGSADAQARAEAIRARFNRGTTLTHGGVNTVITHTPAKASGYPDGDRYIVPISIRYQADIFT